MDKLISIIIPTFNRKELTDKAIESVVSCTPEFLEIVVVDDFGSAPYMYLESVNKSGVTVRVLRLQENVGAGMARKAGIEIAQGKYIAFLDSDDAYDKGWMDYAISELRFNSKLKKNSVMISGITYGARPASAVVRKVLGALPTYLQLTACRLATTFFNAFYTPSILLNKNLCLFKDGMRHCEDYYSSAVAVFQVDMIVLPRVVACHLGREPNSAGGQSAVKRKMFRGEMGVRWAMLCLPCVPLQYKLFVPLGIIYQVVRTVVKRLSV